MEKARSRLLLINRLAIPARVIDVPLRALIVVQGFSMDDDKCINDVPPTAAVTELMRFGGDDNTTTTILEIPSSFLEIKLLFICCWKLPPGLVGNVPTKSSRM